MARDEVFQTKDEQLMKAIQTVRELINEDNSSLTFFFELALEQKQTIANKENKAMQKNSKRENSKHHMQEK